MDKQQLQQVEMVLGMFLGERFRELEIELASCEREESVFVRERYLEIRDLLGRTESYIEGLVKDGFI